MIVIDNTIVSDNLYLIHFNCVVGKCKGACCVEGDAGAPIRAGVHVRIFGGRRRDHKAGGRGGIRRAGRSSEGAGLRHWYRSREEGGLYRDIGLMPADTASCLF